MVLSNSFRQLTQNFVKSSFLWIDVYIGRSKNLKVKSHVVVINAYHEELEKLHSTGRGKSVTSAFTKALLELGEIFVMKSEELSVRNGIAGGFLLSQAKLRASYELLERDAFLFHYRNRIPFVSKSQVSDKVFAFQMQSADPSVHCVLVTEEAALLGVGPCILMGMGASGKYDVALEKALDEYNSMVLDHQSRPNWCAIVDLESPQKSRLADFHHAHSRDLRNLEIFKHIGQVTLTPARKPLAKHKWSYRYLESPIRFGKFIKASHPELTELHFGIPEKSPDSEISPRFHPVW